MTQSEYDQQVIDRLQAFEDSVPNCIRAIKAEADAIWEQYIEKCELWKALTGAEMMAILVESAELSTKWETKMRDYRDAVNDFRVHPDHWNAIDEAQDRAETEASLRGEI